MPQPYDPYQDEEELARLDRKERWRMIAQLGDLAAVVTGALLLFALLALLFSMVNFAGQSLTAMFGLMFGTVRQ